jgi:hypothetical protein
MHCEHVSCACRNYRRVDVPFLEVRWNRDLPFTILIDFFSRPLAIVQDAFSDFEPVSVNRIEAVTIIFLVSKDAYK